MANSPDSFDFNVIVEIEVLIFLFLPNYLSIQVTRIETVVKIFSSLHIVSVSSGFHFEKIFIPPMECMQHLHRNVFGIVDDAFQKNPWGTRSDTQQLRILPRQGDRTKGLMGAMKLYMKLYR